MPEICELFPEDDSCYVYTVYEHTYEMSELEYAAKPAMDEIKHAIEEAEEEFEKLEDEASW